MVKPMPGSGSCQQPWELQWPASPWVSFKYSVALDSEIIYQMQHHMDWNSDVYS